MKENEMRIKIALYQGWAWHDTLDGHKLLRKNTDFNYGAEIDPTANQVLTIFNSLPDWPRNIVHAWELLEEVSLSGFEWNMWQGKDKLIVCDIEEYETHDGMPTISTVAEATAATAPEAISLAFIAWKEAQD